MTSICDWRGEDDEGELSCVLSAGHQSLRPGFHGHLPHRSVKAPKSEPVKREVDAWGTISSH